MSDPFVSLQDVTKVYDGTTVLQIPYVDIAVGKIFGVIGDNGAGKSTFIDIIAGVREPTNGRIRRGTNNIGWCAQRQVIDWFVDCWTNVWLGARLAGLSGAAAKEETNKALAAVALQDAPLKKTPEVLSGGQQQRLMIARTLAMQPDLYLLDEPTVGLDLNNVSGLKHELLARREAGATIIISSHEFESLDGLIDEVLYLAHGQLVYAGQVDKFVDLYVQTEVVHLVFTGKISRLPAADSQKLTYEIDQKEKTIDLEIPRGMNFHEVMALIPKDIEIVEFSKRPTNLREAVKGATKMHSTITGQDK